MTSVAGQKYSSAATASAMKRMTNHTEYTVMASGNRPSLLVVHITMLKKRKILLIYEKGLGSK